MTTSQEDTNLPLSDDLNLFSLALQILIARRGLDADPDAFTTEQSEALSDQAREIGTKLVSAIDEFFEHDRGIEAVLVDHFALALLTELYTDDGASGVSDDRMPYLARNADRLAGRLMHVLDDVA